MAATIKINGWLNEVKQFSWGTALRVASSNRAKNDAGEWETVSRDYYDVVLGDGVTIDVAEGPVVVEGSFKLGKTYAKKDGTTGVELKVRATAVYADVSTRAESAASFEAPSGWAEVPDSEKPF